jgi:hypothetical protein
VTLDLPSGLAFARQLLAADLQLATLVTTRPGRHEPQVAVVNAAIIDHPVTGRPVVAFVARAGVKLTNLRLHPYATLVARTGWEWVAVAGPVDLSGPDDEFENIDPGRQRQLLRDIYRSAGGDHPDLDEYDTTMLTERRCAVLVHPARIWTNPAGSEHVEPQATR